MRKNSILSTFLLFLILLTVIPCQGKELSVGIIPKRPAALTMRLYKPLVDKMSKSLGIPVSIKFSKNLQSFSNELQNDEFDIAHVSINQYLIARVTGYKLLAKNEEYGKSTLTSVIYVRKDSGIELLDDLKGKKILFGGGKKALIPYIGPRYLLWQSGISPEDYEEQIVQNQYNALYAVFRGSGDAGCVSDITLKHPKVKDEINLKEMKKLAELGPFPHSPWVASKRIDDHLFEQIQDFLLNLDKTPAGKAILANAKMTGLRHTSDYEFNTVAALIKEYNKMTGEPEPQVAAIVPEKKPYVEPAPQIVPEKKPYVKPEPQIETEPVPPAAPPEPEPKISINEISLFIEQWRQAWTTKNLTKYISYYKKDFSVPGKNHKKWVAYKTNLFKRYQFIDVTISDMKIKETKNGAQITFIQLFKSDRLNDKGKKTLKLIREKGQWRIANEDWKAIR